MQAAEFRSKLFVEVSDQEGIFILTAPLVFYSAILKREVIVPVGFETDFASIPRIFQNVIQVNGKHRRAAVVHDYLCVYKTQEGMLQGLADKVFREAMRCIDVDFVESSIMYQMVRRYQKAKAWLKGESYA